MHYATFYGPINKQRHRVLDARNCSFLSASMSLDVLWSHILFTFVNIWGQQACVGWILINEGNSVYIFKIDIFKESGV